MGVYFVTSNYSKLKEFQEMLKMRLERFDADLDEIQAIDVEKVVEHKARQAYQLLKAPVIVEDTGLYCEGLGGLPGALTKWFEKALGNARIASLVGRQRHAVARTAICYTQGREYHIFTGSVEGSIARSPRGKNGFGWDSIFVPRGKRKTFAQMTAQEKNTISMRRKALEKLKKFLG